MSVLLNTTEVNVNEEVMNSQLKWYCEHVYKV